MDTILEDDVRNSIGIIPARLDSTRLPRKLLLDLAGKPLLQWTLEGASKSRYLSKLLVATDSQEIAEFCTSIGFDYILTPKEFSSGTERVLWTYETLGKEYRFVVNIQGDEPFIDGKTIDNLLLKAFQNNADISTLVAPIIENKEIFEPSTVKVVLDLNNFAIYFSRSPIPFVRDVSSEEWSKHTTFFKHIGIYCFSNGVVERIKKMRTGKLELVEKLEQLRWMENGEKIYCVTTEKFLVGIDTEQDLELAKNVIKGLI
ncbi:MAG: 3-deoxy-manno-octulosonate cytidylyltransferase [Ignavibacteria bacterium]|nr:3-deoxy-manno-octulosonate cytidylyltransferase [Ignavibacteria bacterium]